MKYSYNGKEYIGTREQILEAILSDVEFQGLGQFQLGEEKFNGAGLIKDIEKNLRFRVQVPYEYKGMLLTETRFRRLLKGMDIVDIVSEFPVNKDKIIKEIMDAF
jgi:hypothetical protein